MKRTLTCIPLLMAFLLPMTALAAVDETASSGGGGGGGGGVEDIAKLVPCNPDVVPVPLEEEVKETNPAAEQANLEKISARSARSAKVGEKLEGKFVKMGIIEVPNDAEPMSTYISVCVRGESNANGELCDLEGNRVWAYSDIEVSKCCSLQIDEFGGWGSCSSRYYTGVYDGNQHHGESESLRGQIRITKNRITAVRSNGAFLYFSRKSDLCDEVDDKTDVSVTGCDESMNHSLRHPAHTNVAHQYPYGTLTTRNQIVNRTHTSIQWWCTCGFGGKG